VSPPPRSMCAERAVRPVWQRKLGSAAGVIGQSGKGECKMISMKTLGLAIGIAFAASSFALAQQGSSGANQQNNPAANQQGTNNAAASNAAAARTMHRTGTAANRQTHRRRLAAGRAATRGLYAQSSGCRFVRVGNNLFRRTCR